MNCPNCRKDMVSFTHVWLFSGLARHLCPGCGVQVRLMYAQPALSLPLRALSSGLAALAVVLGLRSFSWLVFVAILAVAFAVGAFTVARFGRLELDASQAPRGT